MLKFNLVSIKTDIKVFVIYYRNCLKKIFNTGIIKHVNWHFFIFKALLLEAYTVFLLKFFGVYFFMDAHNPLKFQKVFVIHHRNKLTPTHYYQVRQLMLQAI